MVWLLWLQAISWLAELSKPTLRPTSLTDDHLHCIKRWNSLSGHASNTFWRRWSGEYLQQLQKSGKWHKANPNLQVGDLVLNDWWKCLPHLNGPLARGCCHLQAGKDNLIRAVDVLTDRLWAGQPSPSSNKTLLASQLKNKDIHLSEDPSSKLALLLSAGTTPDCDQTIWPDSMKGSFHSWPPGGCSVICLHRRSCCSLSCKDKLLHIWLCIIHSQTCCTAAHSIFILMLVTIAHISFTLTHACLSYPVRSWDFAHEPNKTISSLSHEVTDQSDASITCIYIAPFLPHVQ